ncbi:MAG: Lrp/AsnC ligand binding domain-containing protein [Candidatus Wukongarchaeota archaeon]|nr:Lrp/AsnC ligand binding domain-containing protein [Candidatus Wukongarchaeota archaeon]
MPEEKGPTIVAFLLMRCKVGKEWEIADKIAEKESCKISFPIFGDYDIVVLIEARNMRELDDVVSSIRRENPEIVETRTYVGMLK